ncbi:hypothetical protein [Methanobrevibacter sp. V74]|uniref:hypothetical protein n=1 Tax=Methanobrevibacter sp. V74 TaxID=3064279 RepID=UPI002735B7AE|nr:hypothetical protein [Methanobrevibacter sp. V74]
MAESYKNKSKIATAISFIAALIVYLGKDGLTQLLPVEYASIIPLLIFAAGYIVTQSTENKRVEIAEQLTQEEYERTEPEDDLTEEY